MGTSLFILKKTLETKIHIKDIMKPIHVDQMLVKLDHETWLCRTHVDDFLMKILTILDHTRTRLDLVIKAILINLW